jgi:hypothetical protein
MLHNTCGDGYDVKSLMYMYMIHCCKQCFQDTALGCQSGALVRSMFEINIRSCYLWGSWVRFPVRPISSCDNREGDSHWQRRFPPGTPGFLLHYIKNPPILSRANNVLVDAPLLQTAFWWRYVSFGTYHLPNGCTISELPNGCTISESPLTIWAHNRYIQWCPSVCWNTILPLLNWMRRHLTDSLGPRRHAFSIIIRFLRTMFRWG